MNDTKINLIAWGLELVGSSLLMVSNATSLFPAKWAIGLTLASGVVLLAAGRFRGLLKPRVKAAPDA